VTVEDPSELRERAEALADRAVEVLADAGAVLAPRRTEWADGDVSPQLAEVDRLLPAIDRATQRLAALDEPAAGPLAGLLRMTGHDQRGRLEAEHRRLVDRLHDVLVDIAEHAPTRTLAEAEALRTEAARLRQLADELSQRASGRASRMAAAEVVPTGTHPGTDGLPPLPSPLALAPGEVAVVCLPARMTREGTDVTHSGTLVLTNARLAFREDPGAVDILLTAVSGVEATEDALVVSRYDGDTAERYYCEVSAPQHLLRYLGWMISREAELSG
jgi:hypothetical protein